MVKAWLYLLLQANYEDKRWRGMVIKRGQFVTSVAKLSASIGCSVKQTRTILTRLEDSECIGKQTTNKFTIITICNYDTYQATEDIEGQTKGKQRANEGQTKGNNIRNKEIKNNIDSINIESSSETAAPSRPTPESVEWVKELFNEVCVDFPKVKALNDTRKKNIKLRLSEMKKYGEVKDIVKLIFTKMQKSSFMRGSSWASFDWVTKNGGNWVKVYEGNYDDREQSPPQTVHKPTIDKVSGIDEVNLNKKWGR